MSYNRDKNQIKESKKTKRLRITLAVLYFIEVILTTFPFMWTTDANGNIKELTAFEIAVQPGGYQTAEEIKIAIIFAVFVLFPAVCFFFCVLDKSYIKCFVSFACCIICACLITFGIGATISMGAVVALLLYVLILFLTTTCMMSMVNFEKQQ